MRSRLIPCLAVVLLAAGALHAQTPATVTLTASHLLQGDGATPEPVGYQLCVLTTDTNDNPMSFRVGTAGGQTSAFPTEAVCVPLTSPGVIAGFSVLNSAASAPANACLRITVLNASGMEVDRATCVQTGTAAALASGWCSITSGVETCNWDKYQPSAPAAIVPAPSSSAGDYNVAGNFTATGNATIGGTLAITGPTTFATGQTFPGVPVLNASNTWTAPQVLSNRGWSTLNLLSATATVSQSDCSKLDAPGGDIAVTVTLPAPSSLSSQCALHFTGSLTHALTLTSGTANITSPGSTFSTSYVIAPGLDADVIDFGSGYFVLGNGTSLAMVSAANTWAGTQTFSNVILGSATPSTSPWAGVTSNFTQNAPCLGTNCPSIFPIFPGLNAFGDSGLSGFSQAFGQTLTYPYWSAYGFGWLLAQDLGGVFQSYPAVQDTAADLIREHLLENLAPGNSRNPVTVIEDGGNDARQCQTYPICTNQFKLEKMAEIAWAGVPTSQKVYGQALTSGQKTGTWTADNFASLGNYAGVGGTPAAQPAITGIAIQTTTLTGSPQLTVPIATTVANQAGYCWWRGFATGSAASGAATYGIDSATPVGTLSAALGYTSLNGTGDTVYAQQFTIASAGSHTIYITPTAVPFSFVGCGAMPQALYYAGEPKVLVAGVWKETTPSGASDSNTGSYDTAIQNVITAAAADGIQVAFADVRSYVSTATDLSSDGVHPNIVGYQHVRDAFEAGLMNLLHLTRF